ncbi:hypothetical protein OSH10_03425 [Kaistia defluvii]|uniref:hypothetical protein n=1 Tax=Kaistia defluvii TaxID=410841 RepID=UPI002259C50E|nr:hypothetical protein [Kaistia defluvii]MCX5517476.1 hypothetical protein [Kaistia defluvii]
MGWQPEDTSGDDMGPRDASLRHEKASYIADMTKELRSMASSAGLEFLSYLLAVSEEEARQESQRQRHTG